MKLTNHAKFKLGIYEVPENEIMSEFKNPLYEYYDKKEDTRILIIRWKIIFFVGVCDSEMKKIITVYRTDEKTIQNRKNKKRWI